MWHVFLHVFVVIFFIFSEKIIIFSIIVGNSLYIMMYSFCISVIVVVCALVGLQNNMSVCVKYILIELFGIFSGEIL